MVGNPGTATEQSASADSFISSIRLPALSARQQWPGLGIFAARVQHKNALVVGAVSAQTGLDMDSADAAKYVVFQPLGPPLTAPQTELLPGAISWSISS